MTIKQGISVGLRSGIQSGLNPGQNFPKTSAEWQGTFPGLPIPVHGWVFDSLLPIVDGFGGVDIDTASGAGVHYLKPYKGRGGGACIEHFDTSGNLKSTSNLDWDRSGDWAWVVSWWRQEYRDEASNHTVFVAPDSADTRVFFLQRSGSSAGQNWLFSAQEETDSTVSTNIMQLPDDAGDPTHSVGWDCMAARADDSLLFYAGNDNEPTKTYSEGTSCNSEDDFTGAGTIKVFGSTNGGSGIVGAQMKAIYLFNTSLTRDDYDIYRGRSTLTQQPA